MLKIISLAPLQGITDAGFRTVFNRNFSGIDKYYSPFIRLQNDLSIKKSQLTDILPENNIGIKLIPQILCNTSKEFIHLAKFIVDLGYDEINWNLGCPYPMVAKRQLGSGLLPHPERIEEILEGVFAALQCNISIKMRAGYNQENEILNILPKLEKFPISEVIIHPRIGKQIYRGSANSTIVRECQNIYSGNIAYNGDIQNITSLHNLLMQFIEINHWMIGRALISNPFLAEEIVLNQNLPASEKKERFSEFCNSLYEYYTEILSGPGHLLNKMQQLWEYFSNSFTNSRKVMKLIKKANTPLKYQNALYEIFNNEEFVNQLQNEEA